LNIGKIRENYGEQAHNLVPIIGDNVTLCFVTSILEGVHIANIVTIGSRALVLKDVNEEFITLGGVPAKILKHHNHDEPMLRG
jgi:serine O-acetyltransferase